MEHFSAVGLKILMTQLPIVLPGLYIEEIVAQRLFNVDIFARLTGPDGNERVPVIGRRDADGRGNRRGRLPERPADAPARPAGRGRHRQHQTEDGHR